MTTSIDLSVPVVCDFDVMSDSFWLGMPPLKEWSRTEFDCGGKRVVEVIARLGDTGAYKFVWARAPFELIFVGGMANPCFHKSFAADGPEELGDKKLRDSLRHAVREAFEAFYGDPQKVAEMSGRFQGAT